MTPGLDLRNRAISLVLDGGRGGLLMSLAGSRPKPTGYFGDRFYIVDFDAVQLPEAGRAEQWRDHPLQVAQATATPHNRIQINSSGQVLLKFKTGWRDGTTHLMMSLPEFMKRLAAMEPGQHSGMTASRRSTLFDWRSA